MKLRRRTTTILATGHATAEVSPRLRVPTAGLPTAWIRHRAHPAPRGSGTARIRHRAHPVRRAPGAAHTRTMDVPVLRWLDPPEGPAIALLDQTRLPAEEAIVICRDVAALEDAIRRLVVRGAPILGVAGAFGVALAAARGDDVAAAAEAIGSARPTAVNLAWGARRVLAAYQHALDAGQGKPHHQQRTPAQAALDEARAIAEQDAAASAAMAAYGLPLLPLRGARILTHCNSGALVSAGEGTAFAVILAAHRAGRLARLWVDETRPLLQGARLTAYEARRAGMDYAVLPDAAAASLFAAGEVDMVLTGADRIAADGSVANKIGTYGLAVLARQHDVPFVVVAPVSTIDFDTPDGSAIVLEHRAAREVTFLAGQAIAPLGSAAYNPAFDVTPAAFITALVTERGVARPVTAGNLHVLDTRPGARVSALTETSMER
ncbi:MAG: methylthioribose-phosphate isomerase [Streptosporangiaceae bacterium]|jgi:methylthioribose-1-phosphate isomerase|nr:methylthioribose-phosphate isomerase [Streptosporangiaceae bacterium]